MASSSSSATMIIIISFCNYTLSISSYISFPAFPWFVVLHGLERKISFFHLHMPLLTLTRAGPDASLFAHWSRVQCGICCRFLQSIPSSVPFLWSSMNLYHMDVPWHSGSHSPCLPWRLQGQMPDVFFHLFLIALPIASFPSQCDDSISVLLTTSCIQARA